MNSLQLPSDVSSSLHSAEKALDALSSQLGVVFDSSKEDLVENLSPLQRAQFHLVTAKAVSSIFCLYLTTEGLSHADHAINKELERCALYTEKVQRALDKSKNLFQPNTYLDIKAVSRFIDHAIPDLTKEQKSMIKEIGKKHTNKKRKIENRNSEKKDLREKIHSEAGNYKGISSNNVSLQTFSEKSQVSEMIKSFLENARSELFSNSKSLAHGENDDNNDVKGSNNVDGGFDDNDGNDNYNNSDYNGYNEDVQRHNIDDGNDDGDTKKRAFGEKNAEKEKNEKINWNDEKNSVGSNNDKNGKTENNDGNDKNDNNQCNGITIGDRFFKNSAGTIENENNDNNKKNGTKNKRKKKKNKK